VHEEDTLGLVAVASTAPAGEDQDKLFSLELIPKERTSLGERTWPSAFVSTKKSGADAAWVKHRDNHGLAYLVYTTNEPFGDAKAGDINRIVYGPGDDEIAALHTAR
jgi:hypothetical protein